MSDARRQAGLLGQRRRGVGRRLRARRRHLLDASRPPSALRAARTARRWRRRWSPPSRRCVQSQDPSSTRRRELKATCCAASTAIRMDVMLESARAPERGPRGRRRAARRRRRRPERQWVSCDADHDGVRRRRTTSARTSPARSAAARTSTATACATATTTARTLANADQTDADGDGIGDACDPTPRGEDVDGDAKAALDDRCPTSPAPTADGCPASIRRRRPRRHGRRAPADAGADRRRRRPGATPRPGSSRCRGHAQPLRASAPDVQEGGEGDRASSRKTGEGRAEGRARERRQRPLDLEARDRRARSRRPRAGAA